MKHSALYAMITGSFVNAVMYPKNSVAVKDITKINVFIVSPLFIFIRIFVTYEAQGPRDLQVTLALG